MCTWTLCGLNLDRWSVDIPVNLNLKSICAIYGKSYMVLDSLERKFLVWTLCWFFGTVHRSSNHSPFAIRMIKSFFFSQNHTQYTNRYKHIIIEIYSMRNWINSFHWIDHLTAFEFQSTTHMRSTYIRFFCLKSDRKGFIELLPLKFGILFIWNESNFQLLFIFDSRWWSLINPIAG